MKVASIFLFIFPVFVLFSCEKEDDGEQINATSTSTSSESHNTGQDCLNCHKSGGSGEGWFNVAGTVYDSTQTIPYTSATIEIRTAQSDGGTLVKSIQVDKNGNFYTTGPIDFGTGLYVSVVGEESTEYMQGKITNGACNSCHDALQRIWVGKQIHATSTSTSSLSHNTGQNCMNCHKSGGSGDGWFNVAGTVYNSTQTVPYITATIELRTAQSGGGTLIKSIQVDLNGNFYTTEPVEFGTGLYASVVGGVSTEYMQGKITNAACNSCHDALKRIWVE